MESTRRSSYQTSASTGVSRDVVSNQGVVIEEDDCTSDHRLLIELLLRIIEYITNK